MERLGVRISIHRFRDNVATEASEAMPDGGRLAPSLLGHRDAATAARHYDHSEGMAAAQGFARVLAGRRTRRTDLLHEAGRAVVRRRRPPEVVASDEKSSTKRFGAGCTAPGS